jgi:hypothetical protein
MKAAVATAMLLFALPAFAADAVPTSPPPVTYQVWGFRWDGRQFVKQADHSLTTTDIKQATDYAAEVNRFAGWAATTNLPEACVTRPIGNILPPSLTPDKLSYSVWAFKMADGKWVKDDAYSWSTPDPALGLAYAKKVSAVSGWQATSNCPAILPSPARAIHGVAGYGNFGYGVRITPNADGSQTISMPYMSVTVPAGMLHGMQASGCESCDDSASYDSGYDASMANAEWQRNQDAANLQDQLNLQNQINTQIMNDNIQNQINTQNMIDTQNMVNTQNMIDTQNMINAQMSNP